MSETEQPTKKFPDLSSLVLGAILTAAVLLTVYFLLPGMSNDNPSDSPLPSADSSVNFHPMNGSADEPKELRTAQSFSALSINHPSGFARTSALYDLAQQLDEDSLLSLIDEVVDFKYDSTSQRWRNEALSILLSKLVQTDEERVHTIFFELSEESQTKLAYDISSEWALVNLEGAANFVDRISDTELRKIASEGVLDTQSVLLHTDELKVLAERLKHDQYVTDLTEKNLFIEEAKHPERSWNELARDPTQLMYENYGRISNIAEAWVKQIGVSAIPKVTDLIEDQSLREQLQYQLLSIAAIQDAASAFDYAITLPNTGFSNPASPILSIWAERDPVAAWQRISTLDNGNVQEELTQTLFSVWVAEDAQSLMDYLGQFPNDVQDVARAALIIELIKDSPEAARAAFDEIKSSSSKQVAARTLANYWGGRDGKAALNWVLTDPSTESQRSILVHVIISEMTNKDFQTAFDVARDQPIGIDGDEEIGLEATVIEQLAFRNLEDALELLPLVREGRTKLAAYREVGSSLIRNGRLDEAIANGEEFSGEDQVLYYTSIGFNVNVREDPESIFMRLEKLPSMMARSRIATAQIANNRHSNVFEDDQIDRLKEYLTDEDRELLVKIEEEDIDVPDSYLGF